MRWTGLLAAPLSDGRLQVWGSREDDGFTLWTTWKETTDPDSDWAEWQQQATNLSIFFIGAAAPLPNGALALFMITNGAIAGGVATTQKVSDESTAAWADWTLLVPGRTDGSETSVAVAPLTDGRLQVFVLFGNDEVVGQLLTLWKINDDPNAAWTDPVNFPLPGVGQTSKYEISTAQLSDGRIQLFLTTDAGVFTSWKVSTDPNDAWTDWTEFNPPEEDDHRIVAASLPDGRPQLWRLNPLGGSLWSRWKVTTLPNDAWTEWTPFPQPSSQITQFAVGPLSDGRLQLFAADSSGALFSAWKVTPDPDAAWTDWVPFAGP